MPTGAQPPLVLLVEANEDLREALEQFLASRGYRVVAREETQGAVEAMHVQRPDLVVTDVFLGNTNGLDLITAIRSEFPKPPPIIACSGMPEVNHVALARGANLFLPKPLDPDTFEQAIAALLGARALSRELLEENAKRSLGLRARQVQAACEASARLAPHRATLTRLAERDMRWLSAFLGFGSAFVTVINSAHLNVVASSDPRRWPEGNHIENDLPLCRHILETGSTFVVPDLASLSARSRGVDVGPRFVAGFPIASSHVTIGVLCLVDDQPRRLDRADYALLEGISSYFSTVLSGDLRRMRDSLLMRRTAFETVLGTEFDRAARLGLMVHLFAFSSRTPPPDLLAERTLVAELGAGRFGMITTRNSNDRSPPDLVATVRRLAAMPGFGGGKLVSIEVSAVSKLDRDYLLRLVDRHLEERTAGDGQPIVERVVLHREALAEAS